MASTPAPFCPQCGAPLPGNQRFCTNCGATIEANASTPTLLAAQKPPIPSAGSLPTELAGKPGTVYGGNPPGEPTALPPPPPVGGPGYGNAQQTSYTAPPPPPQTYNPYTNNIRTDAPSYTPPPSVRAVPSAPQSAPQLAPQAAPFQVPDYAQKPKGRGGCVAVSVILLLVLAIGLGGYFVLHALTSKTNTSGSTGTSGTPGYSSSQGSTPTTSSTTSAQAVTTNPLNIQVTYASVAITLISVQKATSFADDTSTTAGSAGVVRINMRENNTTTGNPDYVESYSMLLVLPGNNTVQVGNELNGTSPDQGVNHLNWLDFPLNAQVALNQLILRIGTQKESQMDIPLQANANVSMYQDKTTSPNTNFKYGALNMTLKSATLSYSYHDQQATAGNRYVILSLSAQNTSSDSVSVYPPSYMRMQAGGSTVQPDSTYTLPYSIDASTTGAGVVAFLVPQGSTSFTFIMLPQSSATPAINQVTETFQIQ